VLEPLIRDAIAGFKKDLELFKSISPALVEEKVRAAGFECRRCGKCCSGRFGDNTVTVFPSEARAIMNAAGLEWFDVVRPHESEDVDEQGFYHTFEWVLRKKENGDCAFLEGGKCAIYAVRPRICRTYPMRLEGEALEFYECDSLGANVSDVEAQDMAETLLERQVAEVRESVSLLEKYEAYRPPAVPPAGKVYVVHDGEGSRMVLEQDDGSFRFM
jgi:uncharacterized protein